MGNLARSLAAAASLLLLLASPARGGAEGEVETLGLEEALAAALANSLDAANAAIEVSKSEKSLAIVRGGRLPEVSLEGAYTRFELPESQEVPVPGYDNPDSDADAALKARLPLYTGGRIPAAERQAALGVELARVAERAVRCDVLLETASSFYDLLAAQALVGIGAEALEASRRHLSDVEALLRQGLVAKVDIFRTELDVAERERDVAAAEANLLRGAERLASLLHPERPVTVRARGEVPGPSELSPLEEWVALAEERSPEIAAARLGVDLAAEGVSASKAERFPTLGLFGAWGARAREPSLGSDDRYWNAGLSLALPLYRGGRTTLGIERSRDTSRQAENSLVLGRRLVRRAIVDAHAGANLGLRQAAAAAKAMTAAGENLRVTELKYREGLVTNTDVIDALLSLARARFDRVEALRNYHVGRARLARLAGTIEEAP